MTKRSQASKAPATAKNTAKKAPAAKRFLMPKVDLGGLGGGYEDDELPPLDLGKFDRSSQSGPPVEERAPAAFESERAQNPGPAAVVPGSPTGTMSPPVATPSAVLATPPHNAGATDTAEEESPAFSTLPSPTPAPDISGRSPASAPATPPSDAESEQRTSSVPSGRTTSEPPEASAATGDGRAGAAAAVWNEDVARQPARTWSAGQAGSAVPARRPRRTPGRPFAPGQSHQRRDDRLRQLVNRAPRYAALLQSYAVAQSGKETYQNRNIQLYGLTAQELADRITVDKAVMTAVNLPTPRFTPAHYIDAVLDQALSGLDPQGTDIQNMDAERDIVWALAQDGLAYRDYVTADPEIAAMRKPRSQCPLRTRVNQRYSRMMDILRTMPDLKAQPFEIASACVAKYLEGLQAEQPAFEEFWNRNLVSSYE